MKMEAEVRVRHLQAEIPKIRIEAWDSVSLGPLQDHPSGSWTSDFWSPQLESKSV
jgi:hypothetical protein